MSKAVWSCSSLRAQRSNPRRHWQKAGCFVALLLAMTASPPVKDNAGDDEHCRHRQHLRKRFRGRPLGGFLHAVLPRPGRDSSLRENARTKVRVLLGTPHDEYSL